MRWSDALIADAVGHRRLLPPRVRRADDAAHLRRPAHRAGRRPAGRARPGARRLPPRRGPLRAGEPRRRDRRRLPPQRGHQAAGRRRLRALLRRVHRAGCTRSPTSRVRFLGGVWDQDAARPALRQLLHLPARALGRRHQPLAAARPRRRCGRHRLRRRLQPRGHGRGRRVLAPAPTTSPRSWTPPRPTPPGVGHATARAPASWPRRYDWDDVAGRLRAAGPAAGRA